MTTRSSTLSGLAVALGFSAVSLCSAVAVAQPPRPPIDRPPPINDPAPTSPIDRGRTEKSPVELGKDVKAPPPAPPLPPRQPHQVWLGWTFGSGYGWYDGGVLESQPSKSVNSGFGAGNLGYFGPEIGYQMSDRFALSLQTRHQVIPKQVTDPTRPGSSAQWAHAALVRAEYLYPYEKFRLYVGGDLGAGDFRFRIDAQPSQGLPSSDTMKGGPVMLGPVVGIIFPVLERLSLVGELRGLVGLPTKAATLDLNIGLQFDAFQL